MAISNEKVKTIQTLTIDLGEIIHSINPVTEKEWTVYEALVDAHRKLRRADTDSLLQLELPLKVEEPQTPKFRKDCPRCGGSGLYRDPTSQSHEPRRCNCNEIVDQAWETVKKEWEEQLATAEA